jgi:sugar phosphate isomerase/epimerase
MKTAIAPHVHVNAPFILLKETFLETFLSLGLNPEIGLDAIALERYNVHDFSEVARQLADKSLSVTFHGPFHDLSPGALDPAVWKITRKRFEQVLRLMPIFKPKTLVCHAGYESKRYGYCPEKWIEKSIEMWSWLAPRVKDEGAVLMLENVFEDGPEDLRTLFEAIHPVGVGFCLDTGHQNAFGKASMKEWLSVLGRYLGQLHLHDNNGKKDEHRSLGTGTIDFQGLFSMLGKLRRTSPVITLEPHSQNDLAPSLKFLERIWPWG